VNTPTFCMHSKLKYGRLVFSGCGDTISSVYQAVNANVDEFGDTQVLQ